MNFILILACTVAGVFLLREPIRRWPYVFYAIAIILDILVIVSLGVKLPNWLNLALMNTMTRGGLGAALFIVVMYIGVLPRKSKVSKWLRPIRAELSITACLLIVGHMVYYLVKKLPIMLGMTNGTVKDNMLWAIIIGLFMLVLIIVLGVTSFRFIKRHMNIRTWRKLQSAAYIFYALIFAHVVAMLAPTSIIGGKALPINLIVYIVILVGYMVLRILRAYADKRDRVDLDKTVADQGCNVVEASEESVEGIAAEKAEKAPVEQNKQGTKDSLAK